MVGGGYFFCFSLDFQLDLRKFQVVVGKSGELRKNHFSIYYREKFRKAVMSSFKGRYTYSVDNKGRVAIPSKLRKNLATSAKGTFVVTRGFEKCLYVYPQDEWNKLEQYVRSLSFLNAQHRFFERTLFEWAVDLELDSQARITVPQDLLHYASIDNEVMILGVVDRLELWSPTVYDEYQRNQPDTYETVAERVFGPQSK